VSQSTPALRTHDGFEWLYVLSGRMRLVLGNQDLVRGVGEAAEFETKLPHWFGTTGDAAADLLSIFGRPGERMLVRAHNGSGRAGCTPTRMKADQRVGLRVVHGSPAART
jgi:hypothetical protein